MFGDNTDQSNTAATTDNVVNPAVPSASDAAAMGTATPTSVPDMSFPAVPEPATPSTDSPVGTDTTDTTTLPTPTGDEPAADSTDMSADAPSTDAGLSDEPSPVAAELADEPTTAPAAPAEPLTSDEVAAANAADDTMGDDSASSDDSTDASSTDANAEATAEAFDTPVTPNSVDSDDLVSIKQQALQDLTPLVDKLDQPAEEQFRTLMRMIQASDNPSLIKQAFDTAQKITDDKERAQALLDVINEINYFTVQNK